MPSILHKKCQPGIGRDLLVNEALHVCQFICYYRNPHLPDSFDFKININNFIK